MMMAFLLTLISLGIWLELSCCRHGFWRFRERDGKVRPLDTNVWPTVTAVVPARDEAEGIADALKSLLGQDYPGHFHIVLVDDQSTDGTADIARALDDTRLEIVDGAAHPAGWTGKLFALQQGVASAGVWRAPDYYWFTDADIVHAPDTLRALVARAENRELVLTSFMARLRCKSFAEKLFVPAFVFFFSMLYPFGAVNSRASRIAGAAGGCMLISRRALEKAGGIEAIRGEIIDDCAMGKLMKKQGRIWLGLTDRSVSVRPYPHISDIRHMVTRTAYAQLNYSPFLLIGTLIGLALMFAMPVAGLFFGLHAAVVGLIAWAVMCLIYQPILKFYRLSPLWGLLLPAIGILYGLFTCDSAMQHAMGRGGMWKGRAQAMGKQ